MFQRYIAQLDHARRLHRATEVSLGKNKFAAAELSEPEWPRAGTVAADGRVTRDFYLDEVLRLAADYVGAQRR